jgi:hypothetical protein
MKEISLDIRENALNNRPDQTSHNLGRSTWVTSPVITIFEPKCQPGEEHLHLLRGSVLRFIENHEGII